MKAILKTILLSIFIYTSLIQCNKKGCEEQDDGFCKEDQSLQAAIVILARTNSSAASFKIKFKAPQNRGQISLQIAQNKFTINAGETSSAIPIKLQREIYTISSLNEGLLFQNQNFDFSSSLQDGVIISNSPKPERDKCYLLDGSISEAIEESCNSY